MLWVLVVAVVGGGTVPDNKCVCVRAHDCVCVHVATCVISPQPPHSGWHVGGAQSLLVE